MGIEFIIPTYNRTEHLFTIVCSILAQTNPNWKIHIVGDNIPNENLERLHYFLNVLKDNRIRFTNLEKRYNDWGHTPRNYGLEHATEDWVVMTGEDNYYTPVFVDNFLDSVDDDTHFVFCNMVHNWTNYQYYAVDCAPEYGRIDIGNFMSKRKYAKQLKLRTDIAQSDYLFVEEYLNKFKGTIKKVPKFLYLHN
jgi:glycosyltransferase involved in cell wall biosynthesis